MAYTDYKTTNKLSQHQNPEQQNAAIKLKLVVKRQTEQRTRMITKNSSQKWCVVYTAARTFAHGTTRQNA